MTDEVGDVPIETLAPEGTPRRHQRRSLGRWVLEWTLIIAVALLVAGGLRTYAFETFSIPSASMEPTLHPGDRIIVSKLGVRFGTINIGDVLVFHRPPAENCGGPAYDDLVKRVIGLPGDKLISVGNTIYVNGKPLQENWPHTEPLGSPLISTTVPANSYFMMGDNHSDSCDSRYWGALDRKYVIGKVVMIILPLSRFGAL